MENQKHKSIFDRAQKWTITIGVASVAIALISLAFTVANIRWDVEKYSINEWQEVVVFSIISDAEKNGITFDDIQSQYTKKAAELPNELPRTQMNSQALNRVLLSLLTRRVISYRSDKKYSVNLETSLAPEYIEAIERDKRLNKLGDEVLQIVSTNPNRYNAEELEVSLKDKIEFTNQEFTRLISYMQSVQAIKVGANGKISKYFEKPK